MFVFPIWRLVIWQEEGSGEGGDIRVRERKATTATSGSGQLSKETDRKQEEKLFSEFELSEQRRPKEGNDKFAVAWRAWVRGRNSGKQNYSVSLDEQLFSCDFSMA